jgi:nucleoid-associated protein YgaU
LTDAASVTKQPTLRRDNSSGASPDAELPPTESPPKPARQTAKQEAKRPAAENSPPKKHDPKTKPAAKTPDKDFQPPDFAREYQPYSEHLQSAQEGATERHDTSRQERDNGRPMENGGASSQARRQTPESSSDTPPTRHCISEGDTLRRLAERYLGSRDRYLDIFQANKDVLFDPQLIPIGVEIVIPAKTVIVAHVPPGSTTADEADATPGTGSGESHDETSAPPTAEHESLTPAS